MSKLAHHDRYSVAGHRILIVGAASGIGRQTSALLHSLGADVIGADLDEDALRPLIGEVITSSTVLDITDEESLGQAVASIAASGGALQAVVNCAGITGETGVASTDVATEDFRRVLEVNTVGAFNLSMAVMPQLVESGYGRILHVASIAGKDGNVGMVSYSASKAAMIGMVKSLGKEYAKTGVTVNAIAPAVVHTPMVEQMPDEQVAYMTSKIPMDRLCTLEEIADAIYWAITPAASFTTGFVYDASGGRAVY